MPLHNLDLEIKYIKDNSVTQETHESLLWVEVALSMESVKYKVIILKYSNIEVKDNMSL